MTDDKRTSRASQTREKEAKKKVWTPPSSLDAPPAPTGFQHRWLRAESLGFQDTKNIQGRIRSGYDSSNNPVGSYDPQETRILKI